MYHLQNTETYIVSQEKRCKVVRECRLPDYSQEPESVIPLPAPSAIGSTRSLPVSSRTRSTGPVPSPSHSSLGSLPSHTRQHSLRSSTLRGQQSRPSTRATSASSLSASSPASRSDLASLQLPAPLNPRPPALHPLDAEPRGSLGQNILIGAGQLGSDEQIPLIGSAEELAASGGQEGLRLDFFLTDRVM